MKTKSRSRLIAKDDLICALLRIEPRISTLSKNKYAQPPHWL